MQRTQTFVRSSLAPLLRAMLIGIAIHSLGGVVTRADVTGSFQVNVSLTPFSCAETLCEEGLFIVAFESRLQLAIALGGITLDLDGALGIEGPELLIWDSQFDLGITLEEKLIFAVPFGRAKIATGEKIPVIIPPGSPLFVRQETLFSHSVSGVKLNSLLVFEDLAFPSPLAAPLKHYSSFNQEFDFGVSFSVEGETQGGAHMESMTSFCLDPDKRKNIIHRSFAGRVCPEGLPNFTVETLRIRDLPLFPSLWSSHALECRPASEFPPRECILESDFNLHIPPFQLGLSTELELDHWLSGGGLQQVALQGVAGPLTLELTWDGLLALKRVNATADVRLGSDERSAEGKFSGTLVPGSGFTRLKGTLTLKQAGFTLKADVTYSKLDGSLRFTEGTVAVTTLIKPVRLDLSLHLTAEGLEEVAADVSVQF